MVDLFHRASKLQNRFEISESKNIGDGEVVNRNLFYK